jgi:hypothetical protein
MFMYIYIYIYIYLDYLSTVYVCDSVCVLATGVYAHPVPVH